MANLEQTDPGDGLMQDQGMFFDILYDETPWKIDIVKLNPFESRSPCGSRLFQWVWDRKILYGELDEDVVEFRITQ